MFQDGLHSVFVLVLPSKIILKYFCSPLIDTTQSAILYGMTKYSHNKTMEDINYINYLNKCKTYIFHYTFKQDMMLS